MGGGGGGKVVTTGRVWWSHGRSPGWGSWALEATGVGRPVCRLIK